jgi:hypothetical protein
MPPEEVRWHTAAQFNGPGVMEHCEIAWAAALRALPAGAAAWCQ